MTAGRCLHVMPPVAKFEGSRLQLLIIQLCSPELVRSRHCELYRIDCHASVTGGAKLLGTRKDPIKKVYVLANVTCPQM
jgi:hypothetical protein